jgi:ABC-type Fe3+-hydroxamate transport system substrate-binding protein
MSARVVSLVPSASETLRAWGVTPVAVTRFCEQPDLPSVGGTKDPDIDAIVALAPDVIVMNPEENRLEDAEQLTASGMVVHSVEIDELADVPGALARLAAAVGVSVPALEPLPGPIPTRCRAFVPIWRRPWMTIGARCYGASVLAYLGVDHVFTDAPIRYPEVDLADAAARRPDVVLAPSEPYPFRERHRAELEEVAPVVFVDGQDLFWWGARTPEALRRLTHALDEIDGRRPS